MDKKILNIINPFALAFIANMFEENEYYTIGVLLFSAIYFGVMYWQKNKWIEIGYYMICFLAFSIGLLTAPLGIVFALIGGLWLTLQVVFLIYLPLLILVIFNGRVIFKLWKSNKNLK